MLYTCISPCQCNIVVCTISKKVICTVHTTILHWQENPMCTYNIFHLQFQKCYLLFEYKPLLKQCRILCHLRLWQLSKSVILNFWAIAGFWRKSYVVHTTSLHKQENVLDTAIYAMYECDNEFLRITWSNFGLLMLNYFVISLHFVFLPYQYWSGKYLQVSASN